jgi:hypothetical protein
VSRLVKETRIRANEYEKIEPRQIVDGGRPGRILLNPLPGLTSSELSVDF